jgi:hypothetical protein
MRKETVILLIYPNRHKAQNRERGKEKERRE